MNEEEFVNLKRMLNLDYIEVGDSKTGKFKVYVDLNNDAETTQKLETAARLVLVYNQKVRNGR